MKLIITATLLVVSLSAIADQSVNGYIRQDGTYVQPHERTNPNSIRFDNYSSQGNTNPYTGEHGSQRNEFSNPPLYNHQYEQRGHTRKLGNF